MRRAGHEEESLMKPSRREAVGALASVAAAVWMKPPQEEKPAAPKPHEIVPLPFKPDSLKGLSAKLISSHHENNYGGAVRNLNKVDAELARATKDTAPWLLAAMRERELTYRNSAILHELYFANLGPTGDVPAGVRDAAAAGWGNYGRFEESFRAAGVALGGGSGWVVLAHDLHADALVIASAASHREAAACGMPLLVLDMYEHAYAMDYGAAAAKYVEAFFANVNWAEVERRRERARKAVAALNG
jgi:Fe-Mn family superoxide dismutase